MSGSERICGHAKRNEVHDSMHDIPVIMSQLHTALICLFNE